MIRLILAATFFVFQFCFTCNAFSQDAHKSRTWTSNKGHKVSATLVEQSSDTIRLQKGNGKTVELKISRLSSADQKYLSKLKEEREQKETLSAVPSEPERVWGKPEVTDDDLLKFGKEFKMTTGSTIRNPFTHKFKGNLSSFFWKKQSVPKFSFVDSKEDSVEKIEGWSFDTIEEKDRKELIKTVNRFIEDELEDTRAQFSIQTTIPDWLELEGTAENSDEKKIHFRLFLYFGKQPHLFRATAESPKRLDFLVKSIATFSETSDDKNSYPEEFRPWKRLNGELLAEEASLKEIKGQKITLVTKGGEEIELPRFKFSQEDQGFINSAQRETFFQRAGRAAPRNRRPERFKSPRR